MYQAYATLALLLVIFEYWYGGRRSLGYITKDKIENYLCQCYKHGTQIAASNIARYCKRITTISTHAQISPQTKCFFSCEPVVGILVCKYFGERL